MHPWTFSFDNAFGECITGNMGTYARLPPCMMPLFPIQFTYYKIIADTRPGTRLIHTRVRHRDIPGKALEWARVPRAGDVVPPRNAKQKGFGSPLCMTLPLLLPLRSFSLASQFHRIPPLFSHYDATSLQFSHVVFSPLGAGVPQGSTVRNSAPVEEEEEEGKGREGRASCC